MTAQGATPPGGGALFPLAVTVTIQALASLASLAAPVMAPAAARTTGLAAEMVGLFVGIAYATASLSNLVSGGMGRRGGAIRMSQVSLLLCALGLAAAATGTPAMILLAAMLIGLGYGPVTPASSHILVRTTPRHRMGLTFSLKQTGVPLGGMLAGLVLPPLIGGLGWQMAALVVAGLCVAAAIVTQTIREQLDDDRDSTRAISAKAPLRALKLVLTTPAIRDMGMCSFFFGAMQLCLTTFLVIYLTTAQNMGLALAGTILAVAQVAGVAGRIGWGWLSDRFIPPRRLLGLLGLAMGVAGVAFARRRNHVARRRLHAPCRHLRRERHRLERRLPRGGGQSRSCRTGGDRFGGEPLHHLCGRGGRSTGLRSGGGAHGQLLRRLSRHRHRHGAGGPLSHPDAVRHPPAPTTRLNRRHHPAEAGH